MKKKYLAYVLSTAMLASMMPTSVYAEVTAGTNIKIAKGTGSVVDSGSMDYSHDSQADIAKFKVTLATDTADNKAITVKFYNTTDTEFKTSIKEASGTLDSSNTADIEIDLDGVSAGTYVAKATIDGKTSDAGAEFTINKKEITKVRDVTLANKTYDGTNNVDVTRLDDDSAEFVGLEKNDKKKVKIDKTATNTVATYKDANVGGGKEVTFSQVGLTGKAAGNYEVKNAGTAVTSLKGNIIAVEPTKIEADLKGTKAVLYGDGKVAEMTVPASACRHRKSDWAYSRNHRC